MASEENIIIKDCKRRSILGGVSSFLFICSIILIIVNYKELRISYIIAAIVILIISIIHGAHRDLNFHCPECKTLCGNYSEERTDGKRRWMQIRYYCGKCKIIWDTGEKENFDHG